MQLVAIACCHEAVKRCCGLWKGDEWQRKFPDFSFARSKSSNKHSRAWLVERVRVCLVVSYVIFGPPGKTDGSHSEIVLLTQFVLLNQPEYVRGNCQNGSGSDWRE